MAQQSHFLSSIELLLVFSFLCTFVTFELFFLFFEDSESKEFGNFKAVKLRQRLLSLSRDAGFKELKIQVSTIYYSTLC